MTNPAPPKPAVGRCGVPIAPPIAGPHCRALAGDERLVIALIRQIVIHGIDAPAARTALVRRHAIGGPTAFSALGDWMALLANAATRQIAVGAPARCCPSCDEVVILAIIGGARRGDFALAHGLLAELVPGGAIDAIAHGAEQLGEALLAAGIALRPVRFTDPAASV